MAPAAPTLPAQSRYPWPEKGPLLASWARRLGPEEAAARQADTHGAGCPGSCRLREHSGAEGSLRTGLLTQCPGLPGRVPSGPVPPPPAPPQVASDLCTLGLLGSLHLPAVHHLVPSASRPEGAGGAEGAGVSRCRGQGVLYLPSSPHVHQRTSVLVLRLLPTSHGAPVRACGLDTKPLTCSPAGAWGRSPGTSLP